MNRNLIKLFVLKLGILDFVRAAYLELSRIFMSRKYKRFKKDGYLPLPSSIIFDLTFKCNLTCEMCYIKFEQVRHKVELTTEQIRTIFDKMPFIKKVTLIGGEIFLRKDIFDILDYFQKKEISLFLSTNGTLIDEEKAKKLLTYNNIEAIGLSIDGPEELHNRIRGNRNAFEKTMNAIKILSDKIFIGVTSVVMESNLHYLKEIIQELRKNGCRHIDFELARLNTDEDIENTAKLLGIDKKDVVLMQNKSRTPGFSYEDLENSLDQAEDEARKLKVHLYYQPVMLKKKLKQYYDRKLAGEHFCKHNFVGRINCDGNVVFCFAIKKSFGNLLEKSFEEIWYSDEFNMFRKKLVNRLPPICETCEKSHNL